MLTEQAAPRAIELITNITKMINIEANLQATPERKVLLGMMADTRGSLDLGLANIRAYLLTGNDNFRKNFDRFWAINTKRVGDIQKNAGLLNGAQAAAFKVFVVARKEFAPLPPKMFDIRGRQKMEHGQLLARNDRRALGRENPRKHEQSDGYIQSE